MLDTVLYTGILKTLERFLKTRDRTSEEVRSFLILKGYDADTISRFLESAKETHLLDDSKVLLNLLDLQIQTRKFGPQKIISQLKERGFSGESIQSAVSRLPIELIHDNCIYWLEKRLGEKSPSTAGLRSCILFLGTKGFEEEMILSCLREKGISLEME